MNYLTGKGFIGKHLLEKVDAVHIPHGSLGSTLLEPFDYFYFLSSYGNLASQTDKYLTYKANVRDVLEAMFRIRHLDGAYKSFTYMSSSSVSLPVQTTYSICKRLAEELLLEIGYTEDKPIHIIRPSSVTGVGEQPEHLIPTLLRAALSGDKVYLDPHATHDFIDVEDVVDGVLAISTSCPRGIYKLCTGKLTSNIEVLRLAEEITNRPISYQITAQIRPYDTPNWSVTGLYPYGIWNPKKTLEQSILKQWEVLNDRA